MELDQEKDLTIAKLEERFACLERRFANIQMKLEYQEPPPVAVWEPLEPSKLCDGEIPLDEGIGGPYGWSR